MLNKLLTLACLSILLSGPGRNYPGNRLVRDKAAELIIGVFRTDGVIVPFAKYTHQHWTNPWPNPNPGESNTIADLAQAWYGTQTETSGAWQILLTSGSSQTVRTSKKLQVCSHCQQVWGLLTDYPNAQPHEKNECATNLGIALSKEKSATAMAILTSDSIDWQRVAKFVGRKFDSLEKAGLARVVSQLDLAQIPPPAARAKIPMAMLNLYRARLSGDNRTVFYFEASKEYAKPLGANDAACHNVSLLDGWIVQNPKGDLTLVATDYGPTDCDWDKGGYTKPFAIITLSRRTFAVVEEDSYEGESYTIFEIQQTRLRRILETYAGSC